MQNKNLKQHWNKLIGMFQPYDGYEVDKYYGVSMIRTKKESKYRIKLMYDYTNVAKLSVNQIEVDSLDKALKIYEILDIFAINKNIVRDEFDFLDNNEVIEEKVW